jgi:polysaccharide chain length determinant protein (PEP-CTERM system associated)
LGFIISFTAENPRLAQQVCSEITSMFIEENLKKQQDVAQGATDFLANQLDEAKRKLDEQDSKLAEFKSKYMGQLPEQEQANMSMINTLTSQLEAVNQQLGRAQQDKTYLDTMLAQQVATLKSAQGSPAAAIANPKDLEVQIAQLQSQLTTLESRYTPDYPDVVKARHQLEQLQAKQEAQNKAAAAVEAAPKATAPSGPEPKELVQLRLQIKFLDQSIKEKTAEQARLQNAIRSYQAKIQLAPSVEEQYKALTRDYATAQQFYNQILAKKTESEMATDLQRRQQGEQFRVMDPPNLPERPTFPNRPMFALFGGVFGLAIGGGIGFLLEFRDRSIRTERDVESALQLPTLALLPVVGEEPENEEDQPSRWKIWKRNRHDHEHKDELEPEVKGQAVGA